MSDMETNTSDDSPVRTYFPFRGSLVFQHPVVVSAQWKVHLKPPQTNLWIMMLLFPDFNFIWTISVRLFKIQNSTLWCSCWVYWLTLKTSCSRLWKTNLNFHTQNMQQQNCANGFFFFILLTLHKHEYFHLHMLKCITTACSDIIFNTNQTWTAKYVLFIMSLIQYFKGELCNNKKKTPKKLKESPCIFTLFTNLCLLNSTEQQFPLLKLVWVHKIWFAFPVPVRRTSGSVCHWYSRNLRSLVGRGRWLRRWSLSRPTQSLMRWRHSWLSSRGIAAKGDRNNTLAGFWYI